MMRLVGLFVHHRGATRTRQDGNGHIGQAQVPSEHNRPMTHRHADAGPNPAGGGGILHVNSRSFRDAGQHHVRV